MSALSYATIVSGPRESSEVPNKSYQMDRALGIKPAFDNVFLSAIALLIHRELFVTSHCVIITGKYACEIASHIANKFGLVAAPAEKNEEAAVIHYTENLNIPYNGFIQVRLGVMQEPNTRRAKCRRLRFLRPVEANPEKTSRIHPDAGQTAKTNHENQKSRCILHWLGPNGNQESQRKRTDAGRRSPDRKIYRYLR